MAAALHNAWVSGDEDMLRADVGVFTSLVRHHATFLRAFLEPIINLIMGMLDENTNQQFSLEDETRRSAIELLIALAEASKGMTSKLRDFALNVTKLPFVFATKLELTRDWEVNDGSQADVDDLQNYKMGLEAIDPISRAFGSTIFWNMARPLIAQYLSSNLWNLQHAALMSIRLCLKDVDRRWKKK